MPSLLINITVVVVSTLIWLVIFKNKIIGLIGSYMLHPPEDFITRIRNFLLDTAHDEKRVSTLDFGWRHGSVRRQLILAAKRPDEYSNYDFKNKIQIASSDRNDSEQFINGILGKSRNPSRCLFGFFHPYCNAGGGGEKVLWKAVETTLLNSPNNIALVYTGDTDTTSDKIFSNVMNRFDYDLDRSRIVFIFLKNRRWVDSASWPRFTLMGQALGSIILSLEAASYCPPDVWCDTMGYPFGYPFIHWLFRIPIVTYTHYPVISTDMLDKIRLMPGFKTNLKLQLKYVYWKLFMLTYRFVGSYVNFAITNSTWTYNHIRSIWTLNSSIKTIYPPCSTEKLVMDDESSDQWTRKNQAVVIAQFRPEKRHELIIRSFARFIDDNPTINHMNLILIGSTRNQEDRDYVEHLQQLAFGDLQIPPDKLQFKTNCTYDEMKLYLHESSFGINAMWNEHFGIAVVEYAASGLITLGHASAGPLLDIIIPWDVIGNRQPAVATEENNTGFFFKDTTDPDYMTADSNLYPTLDNLFLSANNLPNQQRLEISRRARKCVLNKFSDANFAKNWNHLLNDISTLVTEYQHHDI
ncbi:alpha-1,2-mannosyltransferase ALG11 Ecym_3304 [Eremothecium cymbalariae DBVPG|uniref:GDP-Man:Man(3)GlcNAc(2)-PP-Dol alpha-1,2-mannosyltransferase n=1 Tax=Eremothecium cymbalariae (strain CBS 270.75 / DBVPG 7215 / KCTC 17166 / NRRL Y-17582) TaxID=931890 RepID=G8JRM6_ERECY|nr:Hypothetical protein Ecym_3304 [Eremothecium cymbalariae DBVPG\